MISFPTISNFTIKHLYFYNYDVLNEIKSIKSFHPICIFGQEEDESIRNHVEAKNVDVGSLPEGERLIYCGSCGNKTEKDLKFCGNCGTAVITVK